MQFNTTAIDFYKVSHKDQYPEGTEFVYSNFTPRSSNHFKGSTKFDNKAVFFGLQAFIKRRLIDDWNKNFFSLPKEEAVAKYARRVLTSLGPIAANTAHLEELHDLGYLPLLIKALPEGSRVNIKVPVLTVINTDSRFFWLTNYIETVMSAELWGPMTSATTAYEYRRVCDEYAEKTSDSGFLVQFQCHDFSYRGMFGSDAAALSGAAHLLSFVGTDTVPAIDFLEEYYNADAEKELIGCSVPASEHSTVCAYGPMGEEAMFRKFVKELYPSGIVSIVSDSFDYWRVLTEYLPALKEEILGRVPDANGLAKVVVRPDCYSEDTQILTDSGWKLFAELTASDKVAQVLDDGTFEFVIPLEIIIQEYEGDMYHFHDTHGKVDLIVTPNHRMVTTFKGKEKIVFAESLPSGNHNYKMLRSAKRSGGTSEITPMERLKIAFQADGAYTTSGNKIRFGVKKQRKINELRILATDCNIPIKEYSLSDGRTEIVFDVDATEFDKHLNWIDFSSMTALKAQAMIAEVAKWDGTIRDDGRIKFDTSIKEVADVVSMLALYAGYASHQTEREDNRKSIFSNMHTCNIMKNPNIGGQAWKKTVVPYSGKVVCVKVPSGKVLVKRNNCTLVSGNSGDPVRIICGYKPYFVPDLYQQTISAAVDSEFFDGCVCHDEKYYLVDADDNSLTEVPVHVVGGSVKVLYDVFGGTNNSKGYIELNPRIGLIYGDSITIQRAEEIFARLEEKGFASTNVVFGIGSYTYQGGGT